ncbi:MAG: DUF998 domain-containing protein [Gammaproteobacteria bacterium]
MWLRFALISSGLTLLIHLVMLVITGQNPIVMPVSELSRHAFGMLHTAALVLFGGAHIALAIALGGMDRGRLWPIARGLLIAAGIGLIYVAYYYLTASDVEISTPGADIRLWIVASLTGAAMGALQPGLSRQARRLGILSTVCLGLWLWMVPVFFFVDDTWIGAYQRTVGAIYVFWLTSVSLGLLRNPELPRAA